MKKEHAGLAIYGLLLISLIACAAEPVSSGKKPVASGQESRALQSRNWQDSPSRRLRPYAKTSRRKQRIEGLTLKPTYFERLYGWKAAQLTSALKAFKHSCHERKNHVETRKTAKYSGRFQDWRDVCYKAFSLKNTEREARRFFEQNFQPFYLQEGYKRSHAGQGLLTGYYEPIIPVSRVKTSTFSEPILAQPKDLIKDHGQYRRYYPRKILTKNPKNVLAWGRPSDTFFLQVQGSGRLVYRDGSEYRAAFAAHNGHKYKSIGAELLRRGEISKGHVTKQSIEAWMQGMGYQETKALMNHNPRYIFFKLEPIGDAQTGPIGAQGVPLFQKASLAIDRKYHDFGVPIWLETELPVVNPQASSSGGASSRLYVRSDKKQPMTTGFPPEGASSTDPSAYRLYRASSSSVTSGGLNPFYFTHGDTARRKKIIGNYQKTGLLVISQDSGTAIKGALRGDLFFGTGKHAGEEAGIMKNKASWVVLLPYSIAKRYTGINMQEQKRR